MRVQAGRLQLARMLVHVLVGGRLRALSLSHLFLFLFTTSFLLFFLVPAVSRFSLSFLAQLLSFYFMPAIQSWHPLWFAAQLTTA